MNVIKLYNGKVELEYEEGRHRYRVKGETVPSVSRISGILEKPALVYWAANMAADYIGDTLKPGMELDEVNIKMLVEGARTAHRAKNKLAVDIGHLIHDWVEKFIKGEDPPMPQNKEVLKGVSAFLSWAEKENVKFVLSEQPVYSRKHHYAGRLDFTCKLGRKLYLGDLKTGKSAGYAEQWLQLAGYWEARTEEFPKEEYAGFLIINAQPNGHLGIYEDKDIAKHAAAFHHAIHLARWLHSFDKVED